MEEQVVDLTMYDRNASISRASEKQHKLITRQALRDLGLFPRPAHTDYYDPDDILEVILAAKKSDQQS